MGNVHSTGLFNHEGEYLLQEETTISDETWKDLQDWVEAYDIVTTMSQHERKQNKKLIKLLDKEGLRLLTQISKEWNKDKKSQEKLLFRYYSEGFLEYIIFN